MYQSETDYIREVERENERLKERVRELEIFLAQVKMVYPHLTFSPTAAKNLRTAIDEADREAADE